MKNKLIKLSAIAVLLASSNLYAGDRYVCKHGDKERVIAVEYKYPDKKLPCKVTYLKDGTTTDVWSALNVTGYCEQKAEAFAQKQTDLGWACSKDGEEK